MEKRASAIAVLRARLDEDDRPALEDVCHQLGVSQRGTLESTARLGAPPKLRLLHPAVCPTGDRIQTVS